MIEIGKYATVKDLDYKSRLGRHGLLCVEADTIRKIIELVGTKILIEDYNKKEDLYISGDLYWDETQLEQEEDQ